MNVDGNPRFLPQEIITNILQRLPVKSLLRFQCVCKHWKNLIKTPSFIQSHLTHQNPCLLIERAPCDVDPFNFCLFDCEMQFHDLENPPTIDPLVDFHIVGSCNGLICVVVHYDIMPHTPLLWNPATREVREMPVSFDDLHDCWHFGFGFSPFVNDYKVVRVSLPDVIYKVEVYSLKTGSWKDIGFDNIKDFTISDDGVTINGVVFWYGFMLDSDLFGTDRNDVIISFDLTTEVFTVMPPPALVSHVGVKLAVYEDKLALISLHWVVNPQCACIYFGVMEEGVRGSSQERWSLRRKYVHYPDPVEVQAGTIWRNQVVYIDYEMPRIIGETEVEMENVEPEWAIHLINVTTNEHKRFAIPGRRYGFSAYGFRGVYNYVESLVQIGNIQL